MLKSSKLLTRIRKIAVGVMAAFCCLNTFAWSQTVAAETSGETVTVKLYTVEKQQTVRDDGTKVSNTVNEPLALDVSKIIFLNFSATAEAALRGDALNEFAKSKSVADSHLVSVNLPAAAGLDDKRNFRVQTDSSLAPNELNFTASSASSWLINLQLANYQLEDMAYNPADKEIKLYYKHMGELPTRVAYFSGLANGNISYFENGKKLPLLANLVNVLKAANIRTDKTNGVYNLLDGNIYTNKFTELAQDDSLIALAKSDTLPAAAQTLSLTLIRHGKIDESFFALSLASADTAHAYPGEKTAGMKQASGNSKYESVTLSKAVATGTGASKYKTVVLSANDNSLVQSTGETAVSVGAALLCFALATTVYALKRHLHF